MGVYLGKDYSAMQGPCSNGFHVPTHDELASLTQAGLSLGAITSGSGNGFKTYFKMPYAGYRSKIDATVTNQNSSGCYFSCNAKNSRQIYSLRLGASYLDYDYIVSSDGYSIRPFKDYPMEPDSSWTTLKSGSGNTGIFWNSTLGLISISADGNNWITIADKNLGATTVYNSGDILSEANCGKYYQRGNNYGFPWTGTVTTSSTRVDPTGYGPGNYYSSSTFITVSQYTWYTPDNQNLRGGVTGVIPAELKNAYIGEYWFSKGLLGYRPLQSDLKDYSGNGKDGSWYSGTGNFGTIGNKTGAVVTKISHVGYNDHNTTKQHIVTTLNYSGPTVTICGWVYYNSMNSGLWNGVLTNTSSNDNFISLSPRPAQSNRWTVGGGGNLLTANTSASTGAWYFVCGVLTSSGKKVYLNGSLIGSDNTGFTTGQGSIWRLGCGQINSGTNMATAGGTDGYIRHCAVYNRELTADEILEFYTLTA